MTLTILIGDGNQWSRAEVRRVMGNLARVVGEAETEAEALSLTEESRPDVVLLDHDLSPDPSFATRIRNAAPNTKVILMTSHHEESFLNATGKSGADALLPKQDFRKELLSVIRQVAGAAARPWDGRERRRRRLRARLWSGPERRNGSLA
jgi:DNA-binding NarL/FixJ family response regulator